MFQFRFVILALLIPAAGIAAILGGTALLHDAVMPPFEASSSASAAAASGAIAEFASATIDAAARAASEPDVAAALAKGELTPKAEAALLAGAGGYGAPSFALLVNTSGAVVARSGAASKLPDTLGGLPVVAEALTGVSRDGLWIEDDKPVHLTAAAIYDGASPSGGVVLGWAFTPALVQQFSRQVGGDTRTVIVAGNTVIGSLPEGIEASAVVTREPSGEPSRTPMLVPDASRYLIAARPLYPSEPRFTVNTIVDRDPALTALAKFQTAVVVGTLFLLAIVLGIIISTLRAMNRPLELIMEHLSQVQQGGNVGILPEAGLGPMLRLGKQINMLLQSMPSVRPGTAPLFGASTSQDMPTPNFVETSGRVPSQPFPPPSVVAPVAPVAPFVPTAPVPTTPPRAPTPAPMPPSLPPAPAADPGFAAAPQSGLAGLFDDGPDPLAAFRVKPATPAPPPPPPPPPAPVRADPTPELHEMQPEATVMFQVPESLLAASAAPPPAPRAAPPPAATLDDNRTVVAQVPQELLAQVSPKNDVDAADEAHYKEVYEKFVQTRIECGEDISDLSYDRFVAKLLKNRQQIVEKHKARSVRFQVYAKDGKAALRALPVRD
jgi:hypothetical protein